MVMGFTTPPTYETESGLKIELLLSNEQLSALYRLLTADGLTPSDTILESFHQT